MAAYFLDSSALVKRYAQESGTVWIRALTDPAAGNSIFLSRLALVEVAATFARQSRAGSLRAEEAALVINQLRHAFSHEFRVIEVTAVLASHALNLIQTHALRGSDGLHLAAATELHRRRTIEGLSKITFLSADHELNDAAQTESLTVENPNSRP